MSARDFIRSIAASSGLQRGLGERALRRARATNSPACYFDTSEKLPAVPISSPNYHTGSSRIFDTNKQSIEIKMVGHEHSIRFGSGGAVSLGAGSGGERSDGARDGRTRMGDPQRKSRDIGFQCIDRNYTAQHREPLLTCAFLTVGRRRGSPAGGRGRRGGRGPR
jgi:hypothetical protein